ncbi:hypothetical protein KIPB_012575 [Kipferlia bialata]|uniref:Uncharacterized protein n=1 Tax=Kipferlia bialata TaxID=797122 RepID=A0A391P7Q7_9EUKA|nr:hypothetical protein KIPB_012575 [Kipferlia bialata]|eukprot:g12575.t1
MRSFVLLVAALVAIAACSGEVWPHDLTKVSLNVVEGKIADFSELLTADVIASITSITDLYADKMDRFCEIYRDLPTYDMKDHFAADLAAMGALVYPGATNAECQMFVYNMHLEVMANATAALVMQDSDAFLGHSEGYYMKDGAVQDDITTLSAALRDGLDRQITYTNGAEITTCIAPAGSLGCAYIHRDGAFSQSRVPASYESPKWTGSLSDLMEDLDEARTDFYSTNEISTPMWALGYLMRTGNGIATGRNHGLPAYFPRVSGTDNSNNTPAGEIDRSIGYAGNAFPTSLVQYIIPINMDDTTDAGKAYVRDKHYKELSKGMAALTQT